MSPAAAAPSSPPPPSKSGGAERGPSNPTGRVVRLHLAARASLPIGSSLRVTSGALWAPSSLTASDPTGGRLASEQAGDAAYHEGGSGFGGGSLGLGDGTTGDGAAADHQHMYASSVEMVTSPETYPVWRTRKPVVVILDLPPGGGRLFKHRYRYLVVTPGADVVPHGEEDSNAGDDAEVETLATRLTELTEASSFEEGDHEHGHDHGQDGDEEAMVDAPARDDSAEQAAQQRVALSLSSPGHGASTSNDDGTGIHVGTEGGGPPGGEGAPLPVMLWEDPFGDDEDEQEERRHRRDNSYDASQHSVISVAQSVIRKNPSGTTSSLKSLANLPYRTLDINVDTLEVVTNKSGDGDAAMDDQDEEFTEDGVRVDHWGSASDLTFRPYIVREAINRQNRKENCMDGSMDQGGEDLGSVSEAASGDLGVDEAAARLAGGGAIAPAVDVRVAPDMGPSVASSVGTRTPTAPQGPPQRIFFVCYHLPVDVAKDPSTGRWTGAWSESLLAKTEGSAVCSSLDAHWFGTVTHPDVQTAADREALREVLSGMGCTPLFLESDVREAHYYGMCKRVLWPAFHNIDTLDLSTSGWTKGHGLGARAWNTADGGDVAMEDRAAAPPPADGTTGCGNGTAQLESDWDQSRISSWWDAFKSVNRSFADALSAVANRPTDIVWVHDYHLSLFPRMLRASEHEKYGRSLTKKVFFLHIPFPTSQIFRELESGTSVLEGMLSADVVGFHAFDHARHFLSSAKRILGLGYESLEGGLIGVKCRGRTVLVTMSNVSVDPAQTDRALTLPPVDEGAKELREKHKGRSIIAGVDVGQRLSGVSLKLIAYERFLSDNPVWHDRVVLVQRVLLPRSRRADEASTVRELRYLVRRIQKNLGPKVIDYREIRGSSLPINERLVLWRASDILLTTVVKEGLNLLPLEYVYARREPSPPGVVIASEFSVGCSILNGALRINPCDIQATASTIDLALTMDTQEKEGRRGRDIEFVSSSPSDRWTQNVLRDLKDASGDEEGDRGVKPLGEGRQALIDSTAAFLSREHELSFTHLDFGSVMSAYACTKRRVFILDFNGTIVIKEPPGKYLKREILGASGHKPTEAVLRALTSLCADRCNTVVVVSGDSQENVEVAVGHIPNLMLAASNGACFANPPKPGEQRQWKEFDLGVDWNAVKNQALPILSKYTARTNGSYVKLTHSSIGWSYYSCDPEWGSLQASHLIKELESALGAFDVRFVTLKGVIEVVPRRLNKGLIVKKMLREVGKQADTDFILCLGDDISDEKMFTSVFSYVAETGDPNHSLSPLPPVKGEATATSPAIITDAAAGDSPMEDVAGGGGGKASGDRSEPVYVFTAAVGKKVSHAKQYLDDAKDVAKLLVRLSSEETMTEESMGFERDLTGVNRFA